MTLLNIVYDTSITKWQKACDICFIILLNIILLNNNVNTYIYKFDIWKYRNCGPFVLDAIK